MSSLSCLVSRLHPWLGPCGHKASGAGGPGWGPAPDLVAAFVSGRGPQLVEELSSQFISTQMLRVFLNLTRSRDSNHLDFHSVLCPKVTFASTGFPEGG